jgi:hypothetical protein
MNSTINYVWYLEIIINNIEKHINFLKQYDSLIISIKTFSQKNNFAYNVCIKLINDKNECKQFKNIITFNGKKIE